MKENIRSSLTFQEANTPHARPSQITFAILPPPPQVISSCLRKGGSVKVLTFPGKDLTHLKMATLKPFLFMQKHTIHKIQTLIL